jgi:type IV pilus secretin PilQ/predicted competence protein
MPNKQVVLTLAAAAVVVLAGAYPVAAEDGASGSAMDGVVMASALGSTTGGGPKVDDVSVTTGAAEAAAKSEATAASEAEEPDSSTASKSASSLDDQPPAAVAPPAFPGDDVLPSLSEATNNPYLQTDQAAQGASGDQPFRAFLPPTIQQTAEERTRRAGEELRDVLGEEVFGQRVNISTPPDTEIAEVIRLLAERAQLNFVVPAGVISGRVTLNLRDVPLGVALQSLLAAQDLSLVREGENVLRIVPRKQIQPGQVETRTIYIKLNWVTADTVLTALQNFSGNQGQGQVKAHKESNTLIITDTPTNVALLRDIVAQLDVPQKQVMIEARLVELIVDNARRLGSRTIVERRDSSGNSQADGLLSTNGERTETRRRVEIGDDGRPTVIEETVEVAAEPVDQLLSSLLVGQNSPALNFGTVISIFGKEFDVAATLDGLENRNVINILANPRVITLNNEPAYIDITRKIPFIEAQQGVSQNVTAATVRFEESGVKLTVLPTITNNGFIRMKLEPDQKIKGADFFNPTTGSNVPVIDRRTAVTNVIVKDEDTVVIGGLRQIESSRLKAQVPWLGQVPVLGWFYKNDGKFHRKNDLMVFVTPHIVKAPVLTTAESYKYSRIDAHWDLPDYFFDDSVESREARHRGELDMTARNYYPNIMKLPPPPEAAADSGKN